MTDAATQRADPLSPARQKLLQRLNAGGARKVCYPLGYSQRGMWFIDQLEPGTALYNMPFGSRYLGPLDERALWRSLRELVQRHEALRTIFPTRNGVAVQEVLPDIGEIEVTEDLSALPGVEREAALSQRIHTHTHTPFDLARGPLLRFVLFRLGAEDHVLYANMHHINGDGWSVYVLQQELDTLYRAYADGASESPLPTRPLQYGDYAIWQRGWMASLAMQEELDFWKRELRGAEQATLPTDLPRPDILVHRGRSLGAIYPAALCARFAALCLQEKLTPFMALLGLFEVAVARYLGVDDFLVGTPIANRTRVDTEGIVGCFINTLALRSDVRAEAAGGDPSLRALLARVRERTLRAYEHQNLPFSKLVEELVPIQVLSRTPLFQAMFSLENYPSSKPLPGLEQKDVDICVELTKLELTLTMAEQDGVYRSHLEYDANLFTAPRMQRLMTCFHAMLEGLVDNPARAAFNDAWLPAEERASLLAWGTGEGACWDDALVPDLLARAAAAHGEAPAVRAEDGGATHAALGLRAARIARALAAHGVGPDVAVGVMMERGTDLVATVVGALRSGAVYVPLDPAYPADRLSFMAADASLRVLVVDAATRALAPQGTWLVVELEGGRRHDGAVDSTPMAAGAVLHPEHLAYVIYTSGSTGRPKGVGVTQRGLANQLQWVTRAFGLAPEDRFLQKTSISFDSSLEELLAPLLAGACLVPARPRAEHDAEYLAALVASERMTCVDLAPSLLEALLPLIDDKAWSSVRRVICGGEALRADVARSLREKLPHITLVNAYGPTETAIQSAWAEMRGPLAARCAADPAGTTVESASEGVPIGRPVANTTLRVLDARGALVPVGTRGELFIGGAGVARGYLGQARLTAERFVPDSFGPPGARMYRTGDQVRWREDAQLEFLGRVDHQVKLRGYRIELDEIERVLETHEGVRQAITLLREDVPGQPRLVAYVLPAAAAPQAEAMRLHAAKSLPAYMVPVAFVVSEAWPQLPNGKVDRRALPAPDVAAFALRPYVAPRGEVEELVASVFEDVLKRERVGRHDNFFELGGHSLLAVQFISRIRRALEREFRLMDLFTHPTVEGVAHLLADAAASDFPPLQPAPRKLPLPLSFAQARLWFLDRIEGVEGVDLAYLVPFGMRLRGVLDEAALRGALDALAERHEVLRTSFAEMGGEGVQHIAPARRGAFPLALEDRRDAPDRALVLREAVTREMRTPFDLATGPLARARLVRLDVDDHGLVIVMHHAITDGWSINLLLDEFAALYRAFHAGRPSPLPPLAVQYGDYAAWQRGWLVGDRLTQERNWWRTALADAPSQINLPTDRPRPAVQDFRGRGLGFEVDAATTRGLRLLAQSQGATPYMVVLGAWALLLGRLSGQGEVVVGTPTANRPLRELEDLVGFFVNMLPLRLALNSEPTVAQWVDRVRETFLAAHQH